MKNLFLTLFLFSSIISFSQDELHCGTDVIMKKIYATNPALKTKKETLDKQAALQSAKVTIPGSTYLIPVVFHILHVNGPENISDDQVRDGLRILNRDFGKRNPDTTDIIPVFKNLADSTKIQFVLATKNPQGFCTSGIIHYYDTDTDWDDQSSTIYSHTWDPTKYMNVYIVKSITLTGGFGAAGYTYFPGTFSPGDPYDAIVVLNNYFGSIGTGSNFLSRVLTHEVGHWLDLYHVFGGSNGAGVDCNNDDLVNDTPTTIGYLNCPNAAVPSSYQICTPGVSENYQNYMDYSYCCRMFTHGQGLRMQAALQNNISGRDNLWTNANLIATGVINPTVPCVPIADFKYSRSKVCVGSTVTFTDASWNGIPTSHQWTFPGGTPATSTASAPVITYNLPGIYNVTHSSSNSAGSSSPHSKTQIITVVTQTASYSSTWFEGFETSQLPNADWELANSSGGANWQQSSDASYTGNFSAKLDKTYNTRKNITSMTSPAVNISTIANPFLSFRYATAEVTPNHVNTFKVYSSIDCGNTWNVIYSKTGPSLITNPGNTSPFIPVAADWRKVDINLSSIASSNYATFKFEYTRDTIPGANNIFVDDINIVNTTALSELENDPLLNFNLFPNPSHGNFTLTFDLNSKQKIKFTLKDVLGRDCGLMEEREFTAGNNAYTVELKNRIAPGIYFLNAALNGNLLVKKMVIE